MFHIINDVVCSDLMVLYADYIKNNEIQSTCWGGFSHTYAHAVHKGHWQLPFDP